MGHDFPGREKVSPPRLPPSYLLPSLHPPPATSFPRDSPADAAVLVLRAARLPSAVPGLLAPAKGLWRPVFRAVEGRFVTGEGGVEYAERSFWG